MTFNIYKYVIIVQLKNN